MARKWWKDVQAKLFKQWNSVGAYVLAGAAGAVGTALVGGVTVGGAYLIDRYSAEEWVGLLSQPDSPTAVQPTSTIAAAPSCGLAISVNDPAEFSHQHQDAEFWRLRISGGNVAARITSEDGYGHGEVTGYQKLRNGGPAVDTITAAFSGQSVGRGVYYLERTYQGTVRDNWWRGTHVFYDCERGRTLRCPYVLGPVSMRADMAKDPWLAHGCSVEALPSTEPRTLVRTQSLL